MKQPIKNLMLVHWSGHQIRISSWFADSVYKTSPCRCFCVLLKLTGKRWTTTSQEALLFGLSYPKPATQFKRSDARSKTPGKIFERATLRRSRSSSLEPSAKSNDAQIRKSTEQDVLFYLKSYTTTLFTSDALPI